MRKITVSWKDKGLTWIEVHGNFWDSAKLFWMVPSKLLSQQRKKMFKIGDKVNSIASIDAFIIISGHISMYLTWKVRSWLEYPFVKFQVFTISRTGNWSTLKQLRHIFPWKFKRLGMLFYTITLSGCFENTPKNKKDVQSRWQRRQIELFQLMLFGCLLISLEHSIFEVCDGVCF